MIVHDAKEFAGTFYEHNRSDKFRATWPDQRDYVRQNWKHFVVHVRAVYADMLTRNDVPQEQKDRIYDALLHDARKSHTDAAEQPLQLAPNTEAFVGDRRENTRTVETYGKQSAWPLRMLLKGSAARYH